MENDRGQEIGRILKKSVELKCSDIHIKPGNPPIIRVNGELQALPGATKLTPQQIADLARKIMNEEQIGKFRENQEVDLAYSMPGVGRFRPVGTPVRGQ